jgi:hypothetical protein
MPSILVLTILRASLLASDARPVTERLATGMVGVVVAAALLCCVMRAGGRPHLVDARRRRGSMPGS